MKYLGRIRGVTNRDRVRNLDIRRDLALKFLIGSYRKEPIKLVGSPGEGRGEKTSAKILAGQNSKKQEKGPTKTNFG